MVVRRMRRVSVLIHQRRSSSVLVLLRILIHRKHSAYSTQMLRIHLLHCLRTRSELQPALLVLPSLHPTQTRSLMMVQRLLLPLQTHFLHSLSHSRIQRILPQYYSTQPYCQTLQILRSSTAQLVQTPTNRILKRRASTSSLQTPVHRIHPLQELREYRKPIRRKLNSI